MSHKTHWSEWKKMGPTQRKQQERIIFNRISFNSQPTNKNFEFHFFMKKLTLASSCYLNVFWNCINNTQHSRQIFFLLLHLKSYHKLHVILNDDSLAWKKFSLLSTTPECCRNSNSLASSLFIISQASKS
jgi:hypothetical protein